MKYSQLTCVHWPWEPVRPRTLVTCTHTKKVCHFSIHILLFIPRIYFTWYYSDKQLEHAKDANKTSYSVFFCTSWWLVYSLLLPIEYCTCSHIHLQIKWFSISNINTVIASISADSCTLVMCSMRSAYRVDGITITTCAE